MGGNCYPNMMHQILYQYDQLLIFSLFLPEIYWKWKEFLEMWEDAKKKKNVVF